MLPGPLRSRVVAPDMVLSMGQIKLFDIFTECIQMIDVELLLLHKSN